MGKVLCFFPEEEEQTRGDRCGVVEVTVSPSLVKTESSQEESFSPVCTGRQQGQDRSAAPS
jgi:hypothetical protein